MIMPDRLWPESAASGAAGPPRPGTRRVRVIAGQTGRKPWIRCPGCTIYGPHACRGRAVCSCRSCWSAAVMQDARRAAQGGSDASDLRRLLGEMLDLSAQRQRFAAAVLERPPRPRGACRWAPCGAELPPYVWGKPRRYCSKAHREAAYRDRRRARMLAAREEGGRSA